MIWITQKKLPMKKALLSPTFLALVLAGGAILFMSSTRITELPSSPAVGLSAGEWIAPASADTIKNPFKGDAASIEKGKKLYIKNCTVCHGDKGKGDGIAAAGLTPKPADHSSEKIQKQSDGVLYWKISTGRPPMASYKSFSPAERWALINYLRTLKAPVKH
jgi:mono/diheme cytochrome c family protein